MTGIAVGFPAAGFGAGQNGGGVVPPSVAYTPGGQAAPQTTYTLTLPLPWLVPMPGAQQFNLEADVASNTPQTAVLPDPLTVTVQQGFRCRISAVSVYIDNMLTSTNVTWSVIVNGAPAAVSGFQNLRMFPRQAPFVGNTFDAYLLIQGPAVIQVQFTNVDGGAYEIGAALSGWTWAQVMEQQWKNSGGQWAG